MSEINHQFFVLIQNIVWLRSRL